MKISVVMGIEPTTSGLLDQRRSRLDNHDPELRPYTEKLFSLSGPCFFMSDSTIGIVHFVFGIFSNSNNA